MADLLEEIGYYNPLTDPIEVKVDEEKAADWLEKGAIPTDTVKYLFKKLGILADKKTAKQESEVEA